jgi:hypothetical protein
VTDRASAVAQSTWEPVGRAQWTLVGLAILGYLIAILRMPSLMLVEAGCGAIALGVVYVVARRRGPTTGPTQEPLAVFISAFLLLAMPVAFWDPPRGPGFLAAGIGLISTEMLWAVIRYPAMSGVNPSSKTSLLGNLQWGVRWGLGMAVAFSLYVTVLFGVVSLASWQNLFAGAALPAVVAAYFGGGVLGGLIAGALRPLSHWPLGRMAMGFLVAIPVYEGCALASPLFDTSSRTTPLREQLTIGLICALLVGPVVGLMVRSRLATSKAPGPSASRS